MNQKNVFAQTPKQSLSKKINNLLGVWVGISFSGLLIWNGIIGMPSQMASCNVPFMGSEANINLNPGDTLCILSGEIFTGRIDHLPKGAMIKIKPKAIFQPIGVTHAEGSIENSGTIILEDIINAKGLDIDNKGSIEIRHELGTEAKFQLINREDATLSILSNVSKLENKIHLENYGKVQVEGKFLLGSKCTIENKGQMVFEEQTVINGQITNSGIVQSYEKVLIGKNANIHNQCVFIAPNVHELTHKSFDNAGSLLEQADKQLESELSKASCAFQFQVSNSEMAGKP